MESVAGIGAHAESLRGLGSRRVCGVAFALELFGAKREVEGDLGVTSRSRMADRESGSVNQRRSPGRFIRLSAAPTAST